MRQLTVAVLCISALVPVSLKATADIQFTDIELKQITAHGPWPVTTPPDPGNELSGLAWAQQVGEKLFHDKQLSASGALSCADCHIETLGFTDGKAVAMGAQNHVRNTQGLLDVGLQRWFGWDGGTDSLWAASLRPIFFEIEMNNTLEAFAAYLREQAEYKEAIETALMLKAGDDATSTDLNSVNDETVAVTGAKLMAAFVHSLRSPPTPFDLFREKLITGHSKQASGISVAAQRGLKIFLGEANCHVCHFGPNFSNGEFHDTGRAFFTGVGQVDAGRYTGIKRLRKDPFNLLSSFNGTNIDNEVRKTSSVKLGQSNWGQWRTPSLRHLNSTAPYLHDGSLATLRDVVDAYADIDPDRLHQNGEAILKPLDLSDAQRNDLVEFLKTLSVAD